MKTDAGNIKIRKQVRSSSLFKELKHSFVGYDKTATVLSSHMERKYSQNESSPWVNKEAESRHSETDCDGV